MEAAHSNNDINFATIDLAVVFAELAERQWWDMVDNFEQGHDGMARRSMAAGKRFDAEARAHAFAVCYDTE